MAARQIEDQARKSIHRSGLGLGPVITQQVHSNKAIEVKPGSQSVGHGLD